MHSALLAATVAALRGPANRITGLVSRLARTLPGVGAWPLIVRTASGAVFLGFSFGKFLRHEAERGAFERYGIPFPTPRPT
jgi:hypothetical protein